MRETRGLWHAIIGECYEAEGSWEGKRKRKLKVTFEQPFMIGGRLCRGVFRLQPGELLTEVGGVQLAGDARLKGGEDFLAR